MSNAVLISDAVPTSAEVSNDAAIFVHALRTLAETLLTSSVFRFIVTDILSIFRELVAAGAEDISQVAEQVQKAAEVVEHKARETDVHATVDIIVDSPETGKEVAREAVEMATETAKALKDKTQEKAGKWGELRKEASDEAKQDVIDRLSQVSLASCTKLGPR